MDVASIEGSFHGLDTLPGRAVCKTLLGQTGINPTENHLHSEMVLCVTGLNPLFNAG
jgi:hypothetical protein